MSSEALLRYLARRCLLLGYTGPVPPRELLVALENGVGGVVLFGSNITDDDSAAALIARLRGAASGEPVIALDEEGGDVTRLDHRHGSRYPGAAALGRLDDPAVTEQVHAAIGARLAAVGITLDLALVADVNTDPRNPVIGVRSFGSDPGRVATQVAAAVRGLQRSGIAACAKHFPGHGSSVDDSHHQVATVTATRAELDAGDLRPFRAAIAAGARAVMTGHLLVPALDPTNLATVSPAVTTELLRSELGFTGAIVTDALEMRAVADSWGLAEGFVRALIAGADAVETGALDHPGAADAIGDAVVAAVASGRLPEQRLTDAAARTGRLGVPGRPARFDAAVVAGAADRCLEIVGETALRGAPLLIACRTPNGMATGDLPWSFAEHVTAARPDVEAHTVDGPVDVPAALARLGADPDRPTILAVRDPQRFRWQLEVLDAAARHRDLVLVDLGWPAELPAGRPLLRTRGVAPGLLAAAARRLIDGSAGMTDPVTGATQ